MEDHYPLFYEQLVHIQKPQFGFELQRGEIITCYYYYYESGRDWPIINRIKCRLNWECWDTLQEPTFVSQVERVNIISTSEDHMSDDEAGE